ncbi:GNAT family N-acetyltransferase [Halobacterium litoreum]|uniref:GNAT family N-acetyltransferase n=1 Tax=Halobacterium litoreum TaxID=2039234 RepID=A0ABD5NF02_9EURY|nr:GNAT family protein [Halobacterium litoreum]UHH13415.1 GNAT family N-acetyltransferase [Halobacterium litoreum]
MPGATFAEGDSVALRTVEEDDLDFVQTARNDPAVRRPLTLNRPANGEQIRTFFENAVCDDDSVSLLACEADGDDPEAVGALALFDEDDVAGTATISYWIAPDHWGNGYATEAAELLCEHAFDDRRLNKLRADVLVSNDASRGVLESVGFEREGTLREEKFVGGDYEDVHRYGLLAAEWGGR